jgi:quinoprotein glucose dehydrogenase
LKDTGSESYGGGIATASGLFIIAATDFDRKLHVFESKTGKLLWETELPFAGNSSPLTYMANGKQYVVIGASTNHDRKARPGSAYVAFALGD